MRAKLTGIGLLYPENLFPAYGVVSTAGIYRLEVENLGLGSHVYQMWSSVEDHVRVEVCLV